MFSFYYVLLEIFKMRQKKYSEFNVLLNMALKLIKKQQY